MVTTDHKTIAQRILDAFSLGDIAFLEEIVAPDYIQHGPRVRPTREAFFAFANMFHSSFPDGRYLVNDMLSEGDKVMIRWTFQGTHLGEWMGLPGTGKQVILTGMDLWRFADGKFAESWFIGLPGDIWARPGGA
jgi:steroid delta-isomerase-like uncharacterized protein